MKKYIISILALLLCVPATFAQTDSRNRVASTIIADGLAQLPAGNPQVFSQVISEMAATGEQGIQQLASSLNSYGKGEKNSVFEYALSGITDYASSNAGASCREGVKKGLAQAVKTCKNTYYKNFLLSLFGRLASAGDFDTLAGYTGDKDLSATALAAICSLHGVDAKALDFVKSAASGSNVPLASLAKIAEQFRLKGAEDLLLSRLSGADATTRDAIYSALSVIGSEKSLKALAAAAKAAGYAPEASHATDAYIRLLGNRGFGNVQLKAFPYRVGSLVVGYYPRTRHYRHARRRSDVKPLCTNYLCYPVKSFHVSSILSFPVKQVFGIILDSFLHFIHIV